MESKVPIDSDSPHSSGQPAPPPYSGYPPQGLPPPGPPTVTITTLPAAVIVTHSVGPNPTHTTCRSCNQNMVTRIDKKATTRTHVMAALLCLFGCWPCVCIPYCVDSCLNTDHYCTNCGAYVGTYMR